MVLYFLLGVLFLGMNFEGEVLFRMMRYFGSDVRRINHAVKVLGFAKGIALREGVSEFQLSVLIAAGVLHDIGILECERKYGSTAGGLQEKEGPAIARGILLGMQVDEALMDRVCFLIGHHHSYSVIDGIDFQILVEADFLVNIFEDGLGKPEIEAIRRKVFRTGAGLELLDSMYLN